MTCRKPTTNQTPRLRQVSKLRYCTMASPQANGVATPPPATQATTLGGTSPPATQSSATIEADKPTNAFQLPPEPTTSSQDDGMTKRPRDARLIHALLASLGVQSYEERVPQMLMDFGYRYASGVLADARDLTAEAVQNASSGRGGSSTAAAQDGDVSMEALRIAIAAKSQFQIQPRLPKEDLLELANEINRRPLPVPQREFGHRLPAEKYCALGTGWGTKPRWSLEEEFDMEEAGEAEERAGEDATMKDVTGEVMAEDEEVDREEFEDVMGGGADSTMKDA